MRGVTCIAVMALLGCSTEARPSSFTESLMLGERSVSAQTLNRGEQVYRQFCASCHGRDGSGQGPAGRGLQREPRDFRRARFRYKSTPGDRLPTDADMLTTIREGRVARGMPAFPMIPPGDRRAVVQYIKTFSPRWRETGR